MRGFFTALLLLLPASAWAACSGSSPTYTAADTTRTEVNACIAVAVAGDTVNVPAGGSEDSPTSWTSGVTIPAGVKVAGAGSGRVIAYSEPSQTVGTGAKTFTLGSTDSGAAWTGTGLSISAGQTLRIYRMGTRATYMEGTVTSYTTNSLVMDITTTGGSGTAKRWLVTTKCTTCIQHNAGTSVVFSMTEHATLRSEFSGIKIKAGTGTGFPIRMNWASGGKAMLLHDFQTEVGSSTTQAVIFSTTTRGVIWNWSCDSSPFTSAPLCFQMADVPNNIGAWSEAPYWGANDTTGEKNLYIENSDFHALLNAVDATDNTRIVVRHSKFNHTGFATHGADSAYFGLRTAEIYNNGFIYNGYSDGTTFNVTRWFLIRGGSAVITDNVFQCCTGNDFGALRPVMSLAMYVLRCSGTCKAEYRCWGDGIPGTQYPAPRQPGRGYIDGSAGLDAAGIPIGELEPIYFWNNTGSTTFTKSAVNFSPNECSATPDTASDYVVAGTDYYVDGTARPSYVKFEHPHPARAEDGGEVVSATFRGGLTIRGGVTTR